uniref:Uncharacterized protein n=1 Tax=viral metagenome TaxID=1070528 RepID=A0A6C0IHT0_9ZZZZ
MNEPYSFIKMHPALKVTRYNKGYNKEILSVIKVVKESTYNDQEIQIYVDNEKVITTPLPSPKVKKD